MTGGYVVECPCGFKAVSTSEEGAERWQKSHAQASVKECGFGYNPTITSK